MVVSITFSRVNFYMFLLYANFGNIPWYTMSFAFDFSAKTTIANSLFFIVVFGGWQRVSRAFPQLFLEQFLFFYLTRTLGIPFDTPCHLKITKYKKRMMVSNIFNHFSLINDMVCHSRFHNFLLGCFYLFYLMRTFGIDHDRLCR